MVRKADLVAMQEKAQRKALCEEVKQILLSAILAKDLADPKTNIRLVALDMQRYGEGRCSWGPWWFIGLWDCGNICDGKPDYCKDCQFEGAPKLEDYADPADVVECWFGDVYPVESLERFVRDRAKWVEPKLTDSLPPLYKELRELPQQQLIMRTMSLDFGGMECFYSSMTTRSTSRTSSRPSR